MRQQSYPPSKRGLERIKASWASYEPENEKGKDRPKREFVFVLTLPLRVIGWCAGIVAASYQDAKKSNRGRS